MADTLKFGPEWLRALSDGNSVTSPPPSPGFAKYKLAEHRYGREEMLALFVPNAKIPETLKEFPAVVIEPCQQPLAFIPASEEEQRLLSQSVNSTAVLRLMGRGTGPMVRGGRAGGDRGRGRGRGRGEPFFQRGTSFDEDGFGRGRHGRGEGLWDEVRGEKRGFERGFPTRPGFDESQTSPRRELSRSMSTENWRDAKDEEDGDWRRAGPRERWNSRGSWREPRERGFERYGEEHHRPFEGGRPPYMRSRSSGSWDEDHDPDVPEWDTDDMDTPGTFDSSGAFMSMKELKEVEEKDKEDDDNGRRQETGERGDTNDGEKRKLNGAKSKKDSESPAKTTPEFDKAESQDLSMKDKSDRSKSSRERSDSPQVQAQRKDSEINNKTEKKDSYNAGRATRAEAAESGTNAGVQPGSASRPPERTGFEPQQAVNVPSEKVSNEKPAVKADISKSCSPLAGSHQEEHVTMATRVATAEKPPSVVPDQSMESVVENGQQAAALPKDILDDGQFDHLEKAAEDLVATWTAEEDAKSDSKAKVEAGSVPMDHEDAKKWFYRDPQGDLQGPFTSSEMAEWFSAGYFTMNLLVKRGCDESFQPLGELIKRWGRVPFLPGPTMPPLKQSSPTQGHAPSPTVSVAAPVAVSSSAAAAAATAGGAPAGVPQPVDMQAEQMKMIHQQMVLQQQFMLRQIQVNQVLHLLNQTEGFLKLSPQQQQQLAMSLIAKQQQQMMQQQQQGQPPSQAAPTQQQQPPKLSPRSAAEQAPPPSHPAFTRSISQQALPDIPGQGMHRSVSQPGGMDEAAVAWAAANNMNNPPTSVGWTQPTSVWDIEPAKSSQSLEEIQRIEMERERERQLERERQQRELEQLEAQRREEEMRKQREREEEEEERKRQEEIREAKMVLERQRAFERQQLERMKMEEEKRRGEEERERRRQEDERRRMEDIKRQQEEAERKRKEQEELERKRQEEIRRRQEKAEEIRRQQEALRRIQQEQMAKMQLPTHAQWASSNQGPTAPTTTGSAPSLQEIQSLEAEKQRKEQEEKQRRLEQQRQQLAAIQQQQQQQVKSWSQQNSRASPSHPSGKSLLEIQQEQARQLELEKRQQQNKVKQQPVPNVSLATAAVWGGAAASSNWASEGAWGNMQKQQGMGFWDDAIGASSKKQQNINSNAHFPSLNPPVTPQQQTSNKSKSSKSKKDEETVQRLFQSFKPKDEFTNWCENALNGMQTSVDIPTFVAFLQDVESPYEIHEYVRSYLGETKEAQKFAVDFLEKRSLAKNKYCQQIHEDDLFTPAVALNPMQSRNASSAAAAGAAEDAKSKKKKKNKMQKVSADLLGFSVHADTARLNVGEIDSIES